MAVTRISNDGIANYSHYNKMSTSAAVSFGPVFTIMASDGYIYSSPDGITWSKKGLPASPATNYQMFKYNNRYLAARADGGFSSTDLVTWIKVSNKEIRDYVQINGILYTLVNDSSFTQTELRASTSNSTSGNVTVPHRMLFNGVDTLVVIGNGTSYRFLTKAITPASAEFPPIAFAPQQSVIAQQHTNIAYNGTRYVVTAQTNLVYSTDLVSWTSGLANISWGDVKYANGTFVASGYEGNIYTSTDGISWTNRLSIGGTNSFQSLAFGNGVWVATNNNLADSIYTSSNNGVSWTSRAFGFAVTAQKVNFL
jgi:hypothetical protein